MSVHFEELGYSFRFSKKHPELSWTPDKVVDHTRTRLVDYFSRPSSVSPTGEMWICIDRDAMRQDVLEGLHRDTLAWEEQQA